MSPIDLLNKAGIGGYLLVILSIFSTYLFIKNFILMLIQEREILNLRTHNSLGNVYKNSRIRNILQNLQSLCHLSSHELKSEILYLFHVNFKDVENAVMWLRLGASLSTLLGLFGTVLGMVQLFKSISLARQVDPSLLAGGIWEALLATGMGLFAAITHLVYQYILTSKLRWLSMFVIDYGCTINNRHMVTRKENTKENNYEFNKNYLEIIKRGEALS